MPAPATHIRVFVEADGPVAAVCVAVQRTPGPAAVWQWEVPYGLWNRWGCDYTALWLSERLRRHDARLFGRAGGAALRHAVLRALRRHRHWYPNPWLAATRP